MLAWSYESSMGRSIALLFGFLLLLNQTKENFGNTIANSWIYVARDARKILQICPKDNSTALLTCLRTGSLQIFDQITATDIIPLTPHVRLTRYRQKDSNDNIYLNPSSKRKYSAKRYMDLNKTNSSVWSNYVLKKFFDLLYTHSVQIDFIDDTKTVENTGRGRHRRNNMFPIMAFALTALGMIIVPIGFQFLAVLGGKALLLAKMALLLASINGIKKVASSGVHYGFYHTDPYAHPYPHTPQWDRADPQPRSFQNINYEVKLQ